MRVAIICFGTSFSRSLLFDLFEFIFKRFFDVSESDCGTFFCLDRSWLLLFPSTDSLYLASLVISLSILTDSSLSRLIVLEDGGLAFFLFFSGVCSITSSMRFDFWISHFRPLTRLSLRTGLYLESGSS